MEDVKGYLQIWNSDRLSHNCILKLAGLARSSTFWRVHTMCTAYNEQVVWEGIVLPVRVVWHEGRYCKKQEENRVTLGIIPTMAPTKQGNP